MPDFFSTFLIHTFVPGESNNADVPAPPLRRPIYLQHALIPGFYSLLKGRYI